MLKKFAVKHWCRSGL